jgi:Tfp pilus assembly protein PilE
MKPKIKNVVKSQRHGFLLAEVITALALLAVLTIMLLQFQTSAAIWRTRLEQQYIALAAAESQFERLKAGLNVLDTEAFQKRYPGLEFETQLIPTTQSSQAQQIITVFTRDAEQKKKILTKFTCPLTKLTGGTKR